MIFILTSHAVVVTGGKGGGLWLPGFSGGCGSRGYSRSLYCEAPVQKCGETKKIVQLWLAIISSTEWPPVRIWWHAVGLVGGFSIMTTMLWLSYFSLRLLKHLLPVPMISSASICWEHQNFGAHQMGLLDKRLIFGTAHAMCGSLEKPLVWKQNHGYSSVAVCPVLLKDQGRFIRSLWPPAKLPSYCRSILFLGTIPNHQNKS